MMAQGLDGAQTFTLENRKYLGSKTALLPWLFENFHAHVGRSLGTFCDPMAGTGVIAYEAARRPGTRDVIAGDILLSNVIPLRTFLATLPSGLPGELERLRLLSPVDGYVHECFGGKYFSDDNARQIDAVREEITHMEDRALANACLTSLLYAADKVANSVGQYDSYMKNLHSGAIRGDKHLVDSNALRPLNLRQPVKEPVAPARVMEGTAIEILAGSICDVVYLDPPYNSRQYSDLYHVLENIARWEKPAVTGLTSKFPREHLKSGFSSKRTAQGELASVVRAARCHHLFLSYSSEGLLTHAQIMDVLGPKARMMEVEYPVFGRGAGRSRRRNLMERLYHVRLG